MIDEGQVYVKDPTLGVVREVVNVSDGTQHVVTDHAVIATDGTVTHDASGNLDFLRWLLNDLGGGKCSPLKDCSGGYTDAIFATVRYGLVDGFTIDDWEAGLMAYVGACYSGEPPVPLPKLEPWRSLARYWLAADDQDEGYKDWCEAEHRRYRVRSTIGTLLGMAFYHYDAGKPAGKAKSEQKLTVRDYVNILSRLGYHFRRNVLDDSIEVSGNGANWDRITDSLESKIKGDMDARGFRHVNRIKLAWEWDAHSKPHHPVRDYFSRLTYDGGQHIERMSQFVADEHDAFQTFFTRWAVGVVAKVHEAAQNPMLVLDAVQGLGKSYWVRWLASALPEHFIESPIAPDDKDCLKRLMTSWIWEVAELGSTTRRADREALKHFLSMRQVTVRLPYGHYDLVKPALASFIGTVNNESGILSDPTGSRRFVVCHITGIDWDYPKTVNPDDVWAEANERYKSGEQWQLSPSERQLADRIALGYEVDDPLTDLVVTVFTLDGGNAARYAGNQDASWFVSTNEILSYLASRGWHDGSQRSRAMRLSSVAKNKLGLVKGRGPDSLTGKSVWGWYGLRFTP